MVFLADWKSAILCGKQMTNIRWEIKKGKLDPPKSNNEKEFASPKPLSSIRYFLQKLFGLKKLSSEEKEIIDFVIESSWDKNWEEFVQLIYSTYPIIAEQESAKLDLGSMASKYNELVRPLLNKVGIDAPSDTGLAQS